MWTTAGLKEASEVMAGTGTAPTHIGVGTGTTTPTAADTDLETAVERAAFDGTSLDGAGGVTYYHTWGTGEINANTITEVGIFNAAAAGDMFTRSTFAGFAKTSSYQMRVEVQHKFYDKP